MYGAPALLPHCVRHRTAAIDPDRSSTGHAAATACPREHVRNRETERQRDRQSEREGESQRDTQGGGQAGEQAGGRAGSQADMWPETVPGVQWVRLSA